MSMGLNSGDGLTSHHARMYCAPASHVIIRALVWTAFTRISAASSRLV